MTLSLRRALPHRIVVAAAVALLCAVTLVHAKEGTSRHTEGGQPITLQLQDADLKDVVRVFGQLTGFETKVDADVDGRVTVHFEDMPWDQALQRILAENKCEYEIDGKTIHVRRMR